MMKQQMTIKALVTSITDSDDSRDHTTLDLLDAWRQEDAQANAEQIKMAEEDLREHKRAMNANRTSTGEFSLYP